MVVDAAGDLTEIRHAQRCLRRDDQVKPSLYQRAVACLWHAGDTKARAGALERERRIGRHLVEGVLPGERRTWRQRYSVHQSKRCCEPRAKRRVSNLLGSFCAGERGDAAGLGKIVGLYLQPG